MELERKRGQRGGGGVREERKRNLSGYWRSRNIFDGVGK